MTRNKKIYQAWRDMIQRCTNPNNGRYARYGARGISVCDEWRWNFESFQSWSEQNGFASDLTIDRKDNNGNYVPDNCRWASRREQFYTRSKTHQLTYEGLTLSLPEWAERSGISRDCLWYRLYRASWSLERALNTPALTPQQSGVLSAHARGLRV